MSAGPPIASGFVHRSETTVSANQGNRKRCLGANGARQVLPARCQQETPALQNLWNAPLLARR